MLSNFPAEQTVRAGSLPMATVFISYLTSTVSKGVPKRYSPGSLTRTERAPRTPWTPLPLRPVRAAGDNEVGRVRSAYGSGGERDHRVRGKGPSTGHRIGRRAYAGAGCKPSSHRLHCTSAASWKRGPGSRPCTARRSAGRSARSPPRGNEWAPAHRARTHRRRRRAARCPAAASSSCG